MYEQLQEWKRCRPNTRAEVAFLLTEVRRQAEAPLPFTDDELADIIRSIPVHHAVTYTAGGQFDINIGASNVGTGDYAINSAASFSASVTFDFTGGTAPTMAGFLQGTGTAAAGDILLAHASDPLQGMGDAAYSGGYAPSTTGKLKLLVIKNTDSTNTITFARGAMNGLPIFEAASDAVKLQPGGIFLLYDPTGATTGALTTGTNDKLTVSVGAGSPTFSILAIYGT